MTSSGKMLVVFLDLEGVLIPEIWCGLAEFTNIEELKLLSVNITDNYILEFITTLTT